MSEVSETPEPNLVPKSESEAEVKITGYKSYLGSTMTVKGDDLTQTITAEDIKNAVAALQKASAAPLFKPNIDTGYVDWVLDDTPWDDPEPETPPRSRPICDGRDWKVFVVEERRVTPTPLGGVQEWTDWYVTEQHLTRGEAERRLYRLKKRKTREYRVEELWVKLRYPSASFPGHPMRRFCESCYRMGCSDARHVVYWRDCHEYPRDLGALTPKKGQTFQMYSYKPVILPYVVSPQSLDDILMYKPGEGFIKESPLSESQPDEPPVSK